MLLLLVCLGLVPSLAEAEDAAVGFGIGFASGDAPLGGRLWFNETV
jgi:hypothetical protein